MLRRIALIALLVLVISGLVAGVALGADPTKRVGLVVGFPDGSTHLEVVTVPVSANAYEVLQAADIELASEIGTYGPSVCSINTVGCPADNCFCDPTKYWAYYHLAGGAWTSAMEGVGGYVPADGAVEGFAWSGFDANFNPNVQPPVYSFEQLLAVTAPTAQPVGVPEPGTMLLMGSGVVGLAGWLRLKARGAAVIALWAFGKRMKTLFRSLVLVVGLWVVSSVTAPAASAAGIAGGESVARFLAGLPLAGAQPAPGAQTGDVANRAALVVRYGDGHVEKQCVSFNEESLSGDELLRRSGLVTIIDYNNGIGGAICSIAGQGCSYPSEDCFCRCFGLECEYWAYYYLENGTWIYSQLGAGGRTVGNGGVEGWSWGPGNFSSGTEPPMVSFAEVCADQAAATPTPTPTATATVPTSNGDTTANTPVPVRTGPPQVRVTAGNAQINAGQCTLLEWVTWDADLVQLDGQSVLGQDRREVCPPATRRFVLAATNSAGQTVREVTVSVAGAAVPTVARVQAIVPAPTLAVAAPVNRVPQPSPVAAMPSPTLAEPGLATAPAALAQEQAPPVTADPEKRPVLATLDPALYTAATATPRTRRVLGADGRPTPTPMLVAMAPAAPAAEALPARPAVSAPAPSHTFSAGLLPGYAAYLLILGLLAAAGVWVAWRTGASRATGRQGD